MPKEEILKEVSEEYPYRGTNSMGCDERYYDWRHSIHEAFSVQELSEMTEKELNNLIKLAIVISEGLY
jgi:hypothetical protein